MLPLENEMCGLTRCLPLLRKDVFAPSWCTLTRCYRNSQQLVIRSQGTCNVRPLRAQDRDREWSMEYRRSRKRSRVCDSIKIQNYAIVNNLYMNMARFLLTYFFIIFYTKSKYLKYQNLKNWFFFKERNTMSKTHVTHFFLSLSYC